MRQDLQQKALYLKYLKISAKFVQPCECVNRRVHTYCVTAQVIRSQRIYCDRCGGQYNIFIKEERVCNAKLMGLISKYVMMTLVLLAVTMGFLVLDGYLKVQRANRLPEEAAEVKSLLHRQAEDNVMSFGFVPDFSTGKFDFFTAVNWLHFLYLAVMEVVLISKCVAAQLARAIALRNKLIYVEVRNYKEKIYRTISKENLNCVIERSIKKKKNYALFDKYWYMRRSIAFEEQEYQGLCVDMHDFVTLSDQVASDVHSVLKTNIDKRRNGGPRDS